MGASGGGKNTRGNAREVLGPTGEWEGGGGKETEQDVHVTAVCGSDAAQKRQDWKDTRSTITHTLRDTVGERRGIAPASLREKERRKEREREEPIDNQQVTESL